MPVARVTALPPLEITRFSPPRSEPLPRVVLVHGAMDRARSFRQMARLLAPLEVIAYDRRGYNDSPAAPAGFGVRGHVSDLAGLVAERPSLVFGHSIGGTYALALALGPDRPETLIGVSVFEAPLPDTEWWGGWDADRAAVARGDFSDGWAAGVAKTFMVQLLGERGWESLPERTKQARLRDGRAFVTEIAQLAEGYLNLPLERLDLPLQAGVSEASPKRHLRGATRLMERLSGNYYCVVGSGHGAHLAKPAALAEAVRHFWQTLAN